MSGYISVKERLPKPGETVIVLCKMCILDWLRQEVTEFKSTRKKHASSMKLNPLPEDKSGDN